MRNRMGMVTRPLALPRVMPGVVPVVENQFFRNYGFMYVVGLVFQCRVRSSPRVQIHHWPKIPKNPKTQITQKPKIPKFTKIPKFINLESRQGSKIYFFVTMVSCMSLDSWELRNRMDIVTRPLTLSRVVPGVKNLFFWNHGFMYVVGLLRWWGIEWT